MSETTEIIDNKTIRWEEFKTPKGEKYEVGYPINEDSTEQVLGSKKDFGISVNWPVGTDRFKNTTPKVKEKAAITEYKLYEYNGFYKYKLEFVNTEHYNYHFYDETGDSYQVNTFTNGTHYVRYDSKNPDIVFIKGS